MSTNSGKIFGYQKYRDTLKARFMADGHEALETCELIELVLFAAIPRRDVSPIAKGLLSKFGSLSAVMAADIAQLCEIAGMTQDGAIAIKAARGLTDMASMQSFMERDVFSNWDKLINYCYAKLSNARREHFRVLFLTKKNELIADELQGSGSIDHTPAYPREVIRRALELGAAAIILIHNHPSGDPKPSNADIALTKEIVDAAKTLNIEVHDHIIIARQGYVSMKDAGLI